LAKLCAVERPVDPQVLLDRYTAIVAATESLSEDDIAALATIVQAGAASPVGDSEHAAADAALGRLIQAHLGHALRHAMTLPPNGDILDQIQRANLALVEAAKAYLPGEESFADFLDVRLHVDLAERTVAATTAGPIVRCSFCGKSQQMVKKLIAGPGGVYICNECIDLSASIVDEDVAQPVVVRGPVCGGCGQELTRLEAKSAVIDGAEVVLLACPCGRVIGQA